MKVEVKMEFSTKSIVEIPWPFKVCPYPGEGAIFQKEVSLQVDRYKYEHTAQEESFIHFVKINSYLCIILIGSIKFCFT